MVLRVKDWDTHFERAESRKLKHLTWVAMPLKRGSGYKRLLKQPNGAALFGASVAIVEFAAQCPTRGLLCRRNGKPYTAVDIAITTDFATDLIDLALKTLVDPDTEIEWLEEVSDIELANLLNPPSMSTVPGESPETASESAETPETSAGSSEESPEIDRQSAGRSGDSPEEPPSKQENPPANRRLILKRRGNPPKNSEIPSLHNITGQDKTKTTGQNRPAAGVSPGKPSPSATSPRNCAQTPVRSSTGVPVTWGEVAERLSKLKLSRVSFFVDSATQAGFTPPQVMALIDVAIEAQESGDCQSAVGAVYDRIVSAPQSVQWESTEGWPWSVKETPAGATEANPYDVPDEVKAEHQRRNDEERRKRHAEYLKRVEALEFAYGASLNAMSTVEIEELIGSNRTKARLLLPTFRARGRDSPEVRPGLLELMGELPPCLEVAR